MQASPTIRRISNLAKKLEIRQHSNSNSNFVTSLYTTAGLSNPQINGPSYYWYITRNIINHITNITDSLIAHEQHKITLSQMRNLVSMDGLVTVGQLQLSPSVTSAQILDPGVDGVKRLRPTPKLFD